MTRNFELGKLAKKTSDPRQKQAIIDAQQENWQACLVILAALLAGDDKEADHLAQKYLPNPK